MSLIDASLQTEISELQRKLDAFHPDFPAHFPRPDHQTGPGGRDAVDEWESADIKEFVNKITAAAIDVLKANGTFGFGFDDIIRVGLFEIKCNLPKAFKIF